MSCLSDYLLLLILFLLLLVRRSSVIPYVLIQHWFLLQMFNLAGFVNRLLFAVLYTYSSIWRYRI